MSAHDAKARFGQLLDAARREPVTIEEHGRPVAVVLSKEDFDDLEAIKLEQLRAMVQEGIDALDRGDFIEVDATALDALVDEIMIDRAAPSAESRCEHGVGASMVDHLRRQVCYVHFTGPRSLLRSRLQTWFGAVASSSGLA